MSSQLLIRPETLQVKARKGDNSLSPISRTKSLSPIGNSINFWSSLKGLHSKYEWMEQVFVTISNNIPIEKLSNDVVRYIELALEKFADNYLTQIQVTGFERKNFSYEMLFSWFGFDADMIDNDPDMTEFANELQDCFDANAILLADDPTDIINLLITICETLVIKFLHASLTLMLNTITNIEELTLFFVIYTAEYDARFSIFRLEEYIESEVIPKTISNDGLTVGTLQLVLPDFIKKNYDITPSIEPGCVELLAGISNIIVITNKSDELVLNKVESLITVTNDMTMNIYLNLHRYLLYLTFDEIQKILLTKNSTWWTNSIILDAINTAAKKFRKEIK